MFAEFAPAKLNLALHVRGRPADGYHDLETLFAFADIGDRLTAVPADALSLAIGGRFAEELNAEQDNLVLRAARMLGEVLGRDPTFALILDKALPVASGIGGGSADAAATLRLLARAWDVSADHPALIDCAARLGSDVPACLLSRAAIGLGRGEALRPVDLGALAGAPLILANPGVAVATAPVFAAWDGIDRGGLPGGDAAAITAAGRNDLQPSAIALVPEIAELLEAMASTGANVVRMSGSGATCFTIYANEQSRDRALMQLRAAYPTYWIEPAGLS
ncbi:4-(cytidine 5'-diphospho)-2-C-methyl-D-erythritol kinase [Sphingomonas gilva]|uniref:4-diphosphocytidyl-2-C-methyl-D-erythritol kinase n=1 Tax=Sphingomonas gilva TaxID=2305907 RepID=A0A396RLX2_9SPHN|nr:4-(cytidine 5'-diphospho)-2-C-methyl-D-erythritol kinase [Sphingomonas gilva]RHW17239.1 4-(cytidine 5'-diphospho)-2-C-methyl-D-erythritol kinase [Sphingomonas gilva]